MAAQVGSKTATALLVKPAIKRLAGEQLSRREAVFAAVTAAAAAGVLVYRVLRTGDHEEGEGADGDR